MYDIRAQALPMFFPKWDGTLPAPLTGGVYCISASLLQSVYIVPFIGRWNEKYENYYQGLRKAIVPFERAANDPDALKLMIDRTPETQLQDAFSQYRALRFARLCSCLRHARAG